jgi:hypothetical protein
VQGLHRNISSLFYDDRVFISGDELIFVCARSADIDEMGLDDILGIKRRVVGFVREFDCAVC